MSDQPHKSNDATLRALAESGALDAMLRREGQPGGALHRQHMEDGAIEPRLRPIPESHEKTRPMTIPELANLMGETDRRDRFATKYLWSGWLACEFYDRTLGGPVPPDRQGRQVRLFRFDADQLLRGDEQSGGRPYVPANMADRLFLSRR